MFSLHVSSNCSAASDTVIASNCEVIILAERFSDDKYDLGKRSVQPTKSRLLINYAAV